MNADGALCTHLIQCYYELAAAGIAFADSIVADSIAAVACVHDNKSKWNFYLTNHKRLRFIGAEKYFVPNEIEKNGWEIDREGEEWRGKRDSMRTHPSYFLSLNLILFSHFYSILPYSMLSSHSRTPVNFETWICWLPFSVLPMAQPIKFGKRNDNNQLRKK